MLSWSEHGVSVEVDYLWLAQYKDNALYGYQCVKVRCGLGAFLDTGRQILYTLHSPGTTTTGRVNARFLLNEQLVLTGNN